MMNKISLALEDTMTKRGYHYNWCFSSLTCTTAPETSQKMKTILKVLPLSRKHLKMPSDLQNIESKNASQFFEAVAKRYYRIDELGVSANKTKHKIALKIKFQYSTVIQKKLSLMSKRRSPTFYRWL